MTNNTATSRRMDLLNAAREVFAEKGFEGTRISEIVARAGVAQGTFYLYFPSKVSLVLSLAELVQQKIEAAITEACTLYPHQTIEKSVRSAFAIMEEYRDILGVIHSSACWTEAPEEREHVLSSCYDLIARWIRHEQTHERISTGINADITAVLIAGVVYYAADECYLYNSSAHPEAYIKETIGFIKRALGIA
jgi:AcrR family transcriptional regulator